MIFNPIRYSLSCLIISLLLSIQVHAQNYPWATNKKLVFAPQGGPNCLGPAWVKSNLATVEASPFDGIFISTTSQFAGVLDRNCSFFNPNWTDLDSVSLAGVQWTHCKNNFFTSFSSDNGTFKWFDDAQWVKILNNARRVARAAKAANFAGIYCDNEPYMAVNPWSIAAKSEGHSEAEVRAKARQRGGQIMGAFQQEYPGFKLMTSFLLAFMDVYGMGSKYDLIPDWLNGLLDSLKGNTIIIEGDEMGFYFNNTQDWFDRYRLCRFDWKKYIKPENAAKYDAHVQKSSMIYDNMITGIQEWEHNTYMSLMGSDEYGILYLEGFRWFFNVTPAIDAAVRSAITKYNSGQRLGFDQTGPLYEASGSNSSVTVNITSPANNFKLAIAGSVTLKATATGGFVDFYKNGLKVYTASAAPYEYTVNLPAGSYTFVARANSGGAWGTSNPVNVYSGPIDLKPPVVKITSPAAPNSAIAGVVPQSGIAAEAFDPDAGTQNGSGIASVLFELVKNPSTVILSFTDNTAPYEWSFNTAPFPDGSYSLRATATGTVAAGGGVTTAATIVNIKNTSIIEQGLSKKHNQQKVRIVTRNCSYNLNFPFSKIDHIALTNINGQKVLNRQNLSGYTVFLPQTIASGLHIVGVTSADSKTMFQKFIALH